MEILVCARRVPDTSENEIELNQAVRKNKQQRCGVNYNGDDGKWHPAHNYAYLKIVVIIL